MVHPISDVIVRLTQAGLVLGSGLSMESHPVVTIALDRHRTAVALEGVTLFSR